MSDAPAAAGPAAESATPSPAPRPGFAFTDPGCRTEIRLGALLVLVGVFMWGWLGPQWASPLAWIGVPLVLVGVVLQVRDARREGRPGYPWKLGVALGVGGLLMAFDLTYRERYDGPLMLQLTVILLLIPGLWILGWWPVARRFGRRPHGDPDRKGPA
jgi:uncharacterized membrane protein HdeD (DUF308 family)